MTFQIEGRLWNQAAILLQAKTSVNQAIQQKLFPKNNTSQTYAILGTKDRISQAQSTNVNEKVLINLKITLLASPHKDKYLTRKVITTSRLAKVANMAMKPDDISKALSDIGRWLRPF